MARRSYRTLFGIHPDLPRRGGIAPRAIRLADQKGKELEKGLLRNATLHSITAIRCANAGHPSPPEVRAGLLRPQP